MRSLTRFIPFTNFSIESAKSRFKDYLSPSSSKPTSLLKPVPVKHILGIIMALFFLQSSLLGQCDHNPVIDITPPDDDGIYCPGDVLTLSTQASDSYQWFYNFSNSNTGGTAVAGGSTQSIELNASEWAVVYFYVESTVNGCTEASPTVVWDAWFFVGPAISHPSLLEYCEGETITISNAFPGPVIFQWYQNGSPIPGANGSDYGVTESGTYTLEVAYGDCPNYFLNSGVGPTFTFFDAIVPTISEVDGSLESSSASSYQWYQNGNVLGGATSQTYTPTVNGEYTVTTTDSNGCEATSESFSFTITSPGPLNNCWAPSEWNIYPGSNPGPSGWAVVSESSIILDESSQEIGTTLDNFSCPSIPGVVKACITVPVSGDITFDWAIPGISPLWGAAVERFGYCIDGVPTQLTSFDDAPPFGTGTGTETVSVTAGSEFCLVNESKWGDLIAWTVEVDNFSVPLCPGIDCPGDFNGDLVVDVADFLIFNSAFGSDCTCLPDMDGSGTVDVNDFLNFNSVFGDDCN